MERGFGAHIKRVAAEFRAQLGLSQFAALDPHLACAWLDIPVFALSDLDDRPEVIEYFGGPAIAEFSAVTAFVGTRRFIVYNDFHHPHRQASSLAHELGHALLQHPPAPLLADDGDRNWNGEIEEQAAFLAGVLLVPDQACGWIVKQNMRCGDAAQHYGVSEAMITYRLNKSGAHRIAQRARAKAR